MQFFRDLCHALCHNIRHEIGKAPKGQFENGILMRLRFYLMNDDVPLIDHATV